MKEHDEVFQMDRSKCFNIFRFFLDVSKFAKNALFWAITQEGS